MQRQQREDEQTEQLVALADKTCERRRVRLRVVPILPLPPLSTILRFEYQGDELHKQNDHEVDGWCVDVILTASK